MARQSELRARLKGLEGRLVRAESLLVRALAVCNEAYCYDADTALIVAVENNIRKFLGENVPEAIDRRK